MSEIKVTTKAELWDILSLVRFKASCVDFAWEWDLKPVFEEAPEESPSRFVLSGWLVRTSFKRPDIVTGAVGRGYGRWEYIAKGSGESGVVKTCWLLAELIVRHEVMEAFTYKGAKVFDPHHTVAQLAAAGRLPE